MAETTASQIFVRYRKIIFAVILFMVADAVVIGINFYSTFAANESAVSINLSGRQRMLSQRMTKVLLLLQRSQETKDEAGVARNLEELNLAVGLFDSTLAGFRDGAIVTGGDGNKVALAQVDTNISRQIVQDAYKIWTPYLDRLRPLMGRNPYFSAEQLEAAVTYAQNNNLEVLRLMNNLTSDLEMVANDRARTLRIVLIVGVIVALFNFTYTVVVSIKDLMASDEEIIVAREETAEILSNVREGLFLLNKDRKLGSQFSESLPHMLHEVIHPGMDFMVTLADMVPKPIFEAAEDYIELLLGDRVKESLVTSLNPLNNVPVEVRNPTTGTSQQHYLSFFFSRVLVDDKISHLLVTVQDVTERVLLAQQVEQAKKQSRIEVDALLHLLSSDFGALQQFIGNVEHVLAQINAGLSQTKDSDQDRLNTLNNVLRSIHGIKGEAAALGVDTLEGYAHECEQELVALRESGENITGDNMVRITVLLEGFYERYSSLADLVSRFGQATSGIVGAVPNAGTVVASAEDDVAGRLNTLAQRIAKDQNKHVEVRCDLKALRNLPQQIAQELAAISIQLVRNAMTHGIETPAERSQKYKSPIGELSFACTPLGAGRYNFIMRDDGNGIVPDRLRERLVKNGHLSKEEAASLSDVDVARRLFIPGVSTAETADKDAGHGIGLDVVQEKVNNINGRLLIRSLPDRFTEFHIEFGIAG